MKAVLSAEVTDEIDSMLILVPFRYVSVADTDNRPPLLNKIPGNSWNV